MKYIVWASLYVIGILSGFYLSHKDDAVLRPLPKIDVVKKLDKIEESIANLASSRCMTVQTPILNVNVYETPNLGVSKVPKAK